MSPQFEWQVGSQDGEWETIARAEHQPSRFRRILGRVPPWVIRWTCYAIIVAVVACVAGGYVLVQHRSHQARERLIFQLQSVIDLEVRTFEQRDRDLFLAQQDEQSPGWYVQQTARYRKCPRLRLDRDVYSDRCHPIRPAQVQDVDVRGEIVRSGFVSSVRFGHCIISLGLVSFLLDLVEGSGLLMPPGRMFSIYYAQTVNAQWIFCCARLGGKAKKDCQR